MYLTHVQALTNVNNSQAWFVKNGYFKGGNQGFHTHASKTLTEHTGSPAEVSRQCGVSLSVIQCLQDRFRDTESAEE